MKILTNREYNKLINDRKGYQKELECIIESKYRLFDKIHKLENENFKLKNIIKSYKGIDGKRTTKMVDKLYELINKKLDIIDTSADELDTLFELYYSVKGTFRR